MDGTDQPRRPDGASPKPPDGGAPAGGRPAGWVRRRARWSWAAVAQPLVEHPRLRVALLAAAGVALALAVTGGAAWWTCGFHGCPDAARLAAYRPGGAPLLLDRHGQVITALLPDDAPEVRLAALPAYLPAAFLAVEDRRFFQHGAVDWRRALGALAADLRARSLGQGFSTISMQLARNIFPQEIPGQQRTAGRKLIEVRVAQQLEARFGKPEILELYLNHIYFGNGARGIEAAAWEYFRQPAAHLTLAQAALLAALPKAPTRYDPRHHPERALARRNLVLGLMTAQGRVSQAQADAAARQPLGVRAASQRLPGRPEVARWFVDEVRRELDERFGASLYDQPVRVWTTLDLAAQRAAEEELERQLEAIERRHGGRRAPRAAAAAAAGTGTPAGNELEGAVVALEAATGDVLAWVGGRAGDASQFDRVASARRQVGSAWKPFVYAAALARGIPLNQPIADTPLVVQLGGGATWAPRNYDDSFDGRVTLRDALARSRNVPTVRLAQAVGYQAVADLAASDGIPSDGPILPSMALGTVAASPLKLTAAYTAFASLGWRASPRLLLRVERADGTPLWSAPAPTRKQVLDPAVAYLLDDALRDALLRGSGAPGLPPGFAGRAAGKTGTSTGGNDVWFVGFTPEVVAGVWIGYDEPRPIANQATGGHLAAPVFRRLMTRIYAGRPAPAWWAMPAGVEAATLDPASGLALSPGCVPAGGAPPGRELFLAGHEPNPTCPGAALPGGAPIQLALGQPGPYATGQPWPAGPSLPGTLGGGAPGADSQGGSAAAEPQDGVNVVDLAPTAAAVPRGGGAAAPLAGAAPAPETQEQEDDPAADPRRDGGASTAAAAVSLSGWWDVTLAGGAGSGAEPGTAAGGDAPERGPRTTYRVALHQEGSHLTGEGGRWEVDGGQLAAARSRIELSGTIEGRTVRLRFTESGPAGVTSGTFTWRLAASGDDLTGTFTSTGADAHGLTWAIRLR